MEPFPRNSKRAVYLLVFQDVFTRWEELIPIRRATAELEAEIFRIATLNRYGAPKVLQLHQQDRDVLGESIWNQAPAHSVISSPSESRGKVK
jgi:hypothetical protein